MYFCCISSDEQLYHLIADLFGAGLDTTLTTLKWALLYFASYPELQNVVRGEFDGLNGDDINFQSTLKMPKTCVSIVKSCCNILFILYTTISNKNLGNFDGNSKTLPSCTFRSSPWYI